MDLYMGMVFPWPISFAPNGSQLCQGQSMNIQQYEALYSLMGTVFGGNGSTTFNLPNLMGRTLVGTGQSPLNGQIFTQGMTLGTYINTVAISGNNLPVHTHGASFTPTVGTQSVVIPGSTAQGSLSASVTAKVNVGVSGTASPAANANVYLGGLSAAQGLSSVNVTGPYAASQAASTANLSGVSAAVTPSSNYNPGSSAATVSINAVTGGAVAVQPGGGTASPSPLMIGATQPSMAMNFVICLTGLYPERP